jgi:hypothetical protein
MLIECLICGMYYSRAPLSFVQTYSCFILSNTQFPLYICMALQWKETQCTVHFCT